MLLEIESWQGNCILHLKSIPSVELKNMVNGILCETDDKNRVIQLLCAQLSGEVLDAQFATVDYMLDLDTHWLYTPKH